MPTSEERQCPEKLHIEGFKLPDDNADPGTYIRHTSTSGDKTSKDYWKHEDKKGCLWWHDAFGHWWIGGCSALGLNQGSAWLDPRSECPHKGDQDGKWIQGGSNDKVLTGVVREWRPSDGNTDSSIDTGMS